MVAHLFKGVMDDEWQCWCPSCDENVYVDLENDFNGNMYYYCIISTLYLRCIDCLWNFYKDTEL